MHQPGDSVAEPVGLACQYGVHALQLGDLDGFGALGFGDWHVGFRFCEVFRLFRFVIFERLQGSDQARQNWICKPRLVVTYLHDAPVWV